MAFDISYIIQAIDKFSPVLSSISSKVTQFEAKTRNAFNGVSKFGAGMSRVGRNISLKLGAPLAAMGTKAIMTSNDFAKSMNMVRAVTQSTGSDFGKLRQQAMYLGMTTQYTARQAASAQQYLGLSGARVNEILGAMPQTLTLAASAQLDMGSAANIVTNILHGYGLQIKDLAHVNDLLVTAFTRTNVTLPQLGDALKSLGPQARIAGVPLKETVAVLGELGQVGLTGAIGGRAFRRAITNMLKPSARAQQIMKLLNLRFTDSHGKMLKTVTILKQLENLVDKGAMKPAAFAEIFGIFGGPAMAALVEQGSDAFEKLSDTMEKNRDIAQQIARTQMEGLPGALYKLKAALEHVQITVVDANNTLLLKLIDTLTKLVIGVSTLNPHLRRLIGEFSGIAIAAGPVLVTVGKILGLMVLLGRITFVTALLAGSVAAAVAAVGVAFFYLWEHSKMFRNVIKDIGKLLYEVFIAPFVRAYHLAKMFFSLFRHRRTIPGVEHGALSSASRLIPAEAGTSFTFAPGPSPSIAHTVKSLLHINVNDDNNLVKGLTAESDSDMFQMSTGLNMAMSR